MDMTGLQFYIGGFQAIGNTNLKKAIKRAEKIVQSDANEENKWSFNPQWSLLKLQEEQERRQEGGCFQKVTNKAIKIAVEVVEKEFENKMETARKRKAAVTGDTTMPDNATGMDITTSVSPTPTSPSGMLAHFLYICILVSQVLFVFRVSTMVSCYDWYSLFPA